MSPIVKKAGDYADAQMNRLDRAQYTRREMLAMWRGWFEGYKAGIYAHLKEIKRAANG